MKVTALKMFEKIYCRIKNVTGKLRTFIVGIIKQVNMFPGSPFPVLKIAIYDTIIFAAIEHCQFRWSPTVLHLEDVFFLSLNALLLSYLFWKP